MSPKKKPKPPMKGGKKSCAYMLALSLGFATAGCGVHPFKLGNGMTGSVSVDGSGDPLAGSGKVCLGVDAPGILQKGLALVSGYLGFMDKPAAETPAPPAVVAAPAPDAPPAAPADPS